MSTLINGFFFLITVFACSINSKSKSADDASQQQIVVDNKTEDVALQHDYDTTQWTELTAKDGYVIDIKYATDDNFVKEAVYPCGRCFLKPSVARSIASVRDELKREGYKLKMFDCYRPRPVQYKLWKKVPNPDYVAPPTEGSMHNRGVAVDLTITDMSGKELDMGTGYDFFGPEAHLDYTKHPKNVLDNRAKLKSIMEKHGFNSIRTEWWHYSQTRVSYPLADWQWPCDD